MLITLEYCSGFGHTLTWVSHGFTCVPHPNPPSRLPPHPIPLCLPSAPALSTCLKVMGWSGVADCKKKLPTLRLLFLVPYLTTRHVTITWHLIESWSVREYREIKGEREENPTLLLRVKNFLLTPWFRIRDILLDLSMIVRCCSLPDFMLHSD